MPKDIREEYRSFTTRVPMSLYMRVADMAQDDGVPINTKVNELIRLGLDERVNLDKAVARLLRNAALEEENDDRADPSAPNA